MTVPVEKFLDEVQRLSPELQEEALDFIQFLQQKQQRCTSDATQKLQLKGLLDEGAQKGLFSGIQNPALWQQEVRQDRALPGRNA